MDNGNMAGTRVHVSRWAYQGDGLVPAQESVPPIAGVAMRNGNLAHEGIRVYRGFDGRLRPWLLEQHLGRLADTCRRLRIPTIPDSRITGVIEDVLDANGLAADSYLNVAIGKLREADAEDATPTLTVTAEPRGRGHWLATGEGIKLRTVPWPTDSADWMGVPPSQRLRYAGAEAADARALGYDDCVVVVPPDLLVSGSLLAAICVVRGDRLITPSTGDSPSLTRAWVMGAAARLGLEVGEGPVDHGSLCDADEIFLCGTTMEFGCVRSVDDVEIPRWPSYPVTTLITDRFFDGVRVGGEGQGSGVSMCVRTGA